MAADIKFDWSASTEIDGDHFPEDMLGHVRYAEFLTRFLVSQGFDESREGEDRERNYVLNLNSAWGSGKTYFLKRWAEELKTHYPVVYVDAWKKDYSDDPLMTVISATIDCLSEQAGKGRSDEIRNKIPRKMYGLLKAAAPGAVSAFGKRYLGIDPVAIMKADDDAEVPTVDSDGNTVDMGAMASTAVKYLIDEHESKSNAIDSLKSSVYQWVQAVRGIKQRSLPAFIFVDELDRCRPSYAVEMLETIKHIFDIKGVVFVVATDTEQLQHAVRAVYGEGFDARVYLGRFFNSRFSLKKPDLKLLLNVHCEPEKLAGGFLSNKGISTLPSNDNGREVLEDIAKIVTAFGHTARTAIQIADRTIATISNMPRGRQVDVFLLVFLLCLKERDHELYDEVVTCSFERPIDDKKPDLSAYLKKYYLTLDDGESLRIPIDPLSIVQTLNDMRGSRKPNQYPQGTYSITIDKYIDTIALKVFGYGKSGYRLRPIVQYGYAGRRADTPEQTPKEKVSKKLIEYSHNKTNLENAIHDSEATALWLEYIYIERTFDSLLAKDYQELADLASALDWLDSEEAKEETE